MRERENERDTMKERERERDGERERKKERGFFVVVRESRKEMERLGWWGEDYFFFDVAHKRGFTSFRRVTSRHGVRPFYSLVNGPLFIMDLSQQSLQSPQSPHISL